MYLGIDVGGTKTLLAIFSNDGRILKQHKFPTNHNYQKFLKDLAKGLKGLGDNDIKACCCAMPGLLDRKKGIGLTFGNLPWQDVPIRDDIKDILGGAPVEIENDSKIGGLHEGLLFRDKYKRILYVTIGTGISSALVIDGKLDDGSIDAEPGKMVLNHNGKLEKWEDFASGRALVEHYGKKAAEINDPHIWQSYAQDVAQGLGPLISPFHPDVVIIGGGVGSHFDHFGHFLNKELDKYESNMVPMPPVIKGHKPEEAVIYGCYDYIKQNI